MRKGYRPKTPFNVAMRLLNPTYSTVKGVKKTTYPEPKTAPLIFGSFRTFGGSDSTENGVYTVVDTATIETWYRPDIKSDSRIYVVDTERSYEIIGSPEDIEMRHQYYVFRVEAVGSNG